MEEIFPAADRWCLMRVETRDIDLDILMRPNLGVTSCWCGGQGEARVDEVEG
jgi:hypothetical protein